MSASTLGVLWGTLRYEFLMQVRRKALWIAMVVFSLPILRGGTTLWYTGAEGPESFHLANWALAVQLLLPVVFGVFMADRLPRDFRLNVSELIRATPSSSASHLVGKYLGSAIGTGLPILLIYSAGIVYLLLDTGDLSVIPVGLAVFTTVMVPGLLFVGAFSIACPAILWVPLYQFLFVGYWFWGNALSPSFGIPTLSATILTPIGDNAAVAFFGVFPMHGSRSEYPMEVGVLSIAILIAGASLALLAVHYYLSWARARQ